MDYKEIIELIRDKNKRGIEELYNQFGGKLYNYAVNKWSFTEDQAWEVIYQTLNMLLLKLPIYQLESATHFDNVVFKIFKNYLRQAYRDKRAKEANIEFVSIDKIRDDSAHFTQELAFSVEPSIFTDYYKNEVLESPLFTNMKTALEKMNAEEKDLLLLRAQNYSYDEIASMLRIENRQLKVKYYRAKKKLIELITNHPNTLS